MKEKYSDWYEPLASRRSISEFNCAISLQKPWHVDSSWDIWAKLPLAELTCSCSSHSNSRICFSCERCSNWRSTQCALTSTHHDAYDAIQNSLLSI